MVVSPMLAEAPPRAVFLSDPHLGWQLAQQTTWRGWEIQSSATHITQLGAKYLVTHGDIFDRFQSMCCPDVLRSFGRRLYPKLLAFGARMESQGILPPRNVKHWCSYWKNKSRGTREHIDRFRRFMCELAVRQECDGVICDHVHSPANQWTGTTQRIGVLLRDEVIEAKKNSQLEQHLVVYLRKHAPENLWPALMATGRPCHVYGLGEKPAEANLQFHAIDNDGFAKHLASSFCLITTAGNQLVGEAVYLEKPVLAIPEDGNFEQGLNSLMVLDSGCGWTSSFKDITPHFLQQFLLAVPQLRSNIVADELCGNDRAIEIIQQYLPQVAAKQQHESIYSNAS